MARTQNPEEFAQKRKEIIQTAWGLFFSKGYEATSIQDILTAAGLSKGAFYHYFPSKSALLEGLVDDMSAAAMTEIAPLLERKDLTARDKFIELIKVSTIWKTANLSKYRELLKIWYDDANILLREKVNSRTLELFMPVFQAVFDEGHATGEFRKRFTSQAGLMMNALMNSLGGHMTRLLMTINPETGKEEREAIFLELRESIDALFEALEWLAGAEPGSLTYMDDGLLHRWVEP